MTVVRETCLVEAPSDSPEGYLFDATVDGITFSVTVPKGGVTRGQQFKVPFPTASPNDYPTAKGELIPMVDARGSSTQLATVKRPDGTMDVNNGTTHSDGTATNNVGRWTTELCGCFDVCCSAVWWMGLCCRPILFGQIMQRMGFDICGTPGTTKSESTCVTITAFWLISFAISVIVATFTNAGKFALYPFGIYFVVAATRTRMHMRRKYRIPPSCCGESCWDDCCCAYWCGCCVAIQMHRHTHNTQEYPYSCGSKTGLPDNAPVMAESETIPVTEQWKTNCPDVV